MAMLIRVNAGLTTGVLTDDAALANILTIGMTVTTAVIKTGKNTGIAGMIPATVIGIADKNNLTAWRQVTPSTGLFAGCGIRINLPVARFESIQHQSRHGHQSHAARHGRNKARFWRNRFKINVSNDA